MRMDQNHLLRRTWDIKKLKYTSSVFVCAKEICQSETVLNKPIKLTWLQSASDPTKAILNPDLLNHKLTTLMFWPTVTIFY